MVLSMDIDSKENCAPLGQVRATEAIQLAPTRAFTPTISSQMNNMVDQHFTLAMNRISEKIKYFLEMSNKPSQNQVSLEKAMEHADQIDKNRDSIKLQAKNKKVVLQSSKNSDLDIHIDTNDSVTLTTPATSSLSPTIISATTTAKSSATVSATATENLLNNAKQINNEKDALHSELSFGVPLSSSREGEILVNVLTWYAQELLSFMLRLSKDESGKGQSVQVEGKVQGGHISEADLDSQNIKERTNTQRKTTVDNDYENNNDNTNNTTTPAATALISNLDEKMMMTLLLKQKHFSSSHISMIQTFCNSRFEQVFTGGVLSKQLNTVAIPASDTGANSSSTRTGTGIASITDGHDGSNLNHNRGVAVDHNSQPSVSLPVEIGDNPAVELSSSSVSSAMDSTARADPAKAAELNSKNIEKIIIANSNDNNKNNNKYNPTTSRPSSPARSTRSARSSRSIDSRSIAGSIASISTISKFSTSNGSVYNTTAENAAYLIEQQWDMIESSLRNYQTELSALLGGCSIMHSMGIIELVLLKARETMKDIVHSLAGKYMSQLKLENLKRRKIEKAYRRTKTDLAIQTEKLHKIREQGGGETAIRMVAKLKDENESLENNYNRLRDRLLASERRQNTLLQENAETKRKLHKVAKSLKESKSANKHQKLQAGEATAAGNIDNNNNSNNLGRGVDKGEEEQELEDQQDEQDQRQLLEKNKQQQDDVEKRQQLLGSSDFTTQRLQNQEENETLIAQLRGYEKELEKLKRKYKNNDEELKYVKHEYQKLRSQSQRPQNMFTMQEEEVSRAMAALANSTKLIKEASLTASSTAENISSNPSLMLSPNKRNKMKESKVNNINNINNINISNNNDKNNDNYNDNEVASDKSIASYMETEIISMPGKGEEVATSTSTLREIKGDKGDERKKEEIPMTTTTSTNIDIDIDRIGRTDTCVSFP